MELVSFFVGLVLGLISLSMKRFIWIIRIILSLVSSFLIVKLFYPETIILPLDKWTFENLFYGYNHWLIAISGFIISILFFYWIFQYLIVDYFIKKFEKNIDFNLPNYNLPKLKLKLVMISKYVIKIFFKHKIKSLTEFKKYNNNVRLSSILDIYSSFISILIHFNFCWFFIFDYTLIYIYIISSLLLILVIYTIIVIPLINSIYDFTNDLITSQINRNISK